MLSSKDYKSKADHYANLMKSCFEESQNAWKNGNKSKAKEFSIRGNEYKTLLIETNKNFQDSLNFEKLQLKNLKIKEDVISNIVQVKDKNDKNKDFCSVLLKNEINFEETNNDKSELENLDCEEKTHNLYNHHRELANSYAKQMGEAFSGATAAWESGDKAKAKELSNLGYQFKGMMEIHNASAVKLIATKNNIHRDSDEIDLHGLYVNEAIQFFKETLLLKMKDNNFQSLKVIVGKGLHSKDKPKIKEAVINFANEYKLQVFENPDNPGCLIICVI